MRIVGPPGRVSDNGPEANPDTISYIKTSTPHIHDISISGPYYPFETIFPQLINRLRTENSAQGEATLDELVDSGAIVNTQHFTAPLPDGNIIRFHLLRENNAVVAQSLPGEVWNVIVATPIVCRRLLALSQRSEHPTVEEMDVHRTFKTKEEANRVAERLLEVFKKQAGQGAEMLNGLVSGGVIPHRNAGAKAKMVMVQHDDGQLREHSGQAPSDPQ